MSPGSGGRAAQSTAVAMAAALLATAAAVYLLRKLERRRRPSSQPKSDEGDDGDEGDWPTLFDDDLPEHVAREIEEERERVAKTTLNRSMYDNVLLINRDRIPMCTISAKKARWYVRKDLAEWTSLGEGDEGYGEYEEGVRCVRFVYAENALGAKFGENMSDHLYLRSAKQNVCVGCGNDEHHMRHYVVPYAYRALLPREYKTHMSHDIVILCPDCHLRCEGRTKARMRRMERDCRARLGEGAVDVPTVVDDPEMHRVRNCAIALARRGRDVLPEEEAREAERVVRDYLASTCRDEGRRELLRSGRGGALTKSEIQPAITDDPEKEHVRKCALALTRHLRPGALPEEEAREAETVVREYLASQCENKEKRELLLSGKEELTKTQIQRACSVKCRAKNPAYLTPSEVVVRSLEGEGDVEEFIRGWRRHFVEAVRPRHMPDGWSVDNPVTSGKEARRLGKESSAAW